MRENANLMTASTQPAGFSAQWDNLKSQFHWSYLPPLLLYFSGGLSAATAIAGTFFVKDYLDVSAAFLVSLEFWIGLPWTLKLVLGNFVDATWRWRRALVSLGAVLIAASSLIMYGLILYPDLVTGVISKVKCYVLAAVLAPVGYVLQNVIAEAMTVQVVPRFSPSGEPLSYEALKARHTFVQTLGRFSMIIATLLIAAFNIKVFAGFDRLSPADKIAAYAGVYLASLVIPLLSVVGIFLWSPKDGRTTHDAKIDVRVGTELPARRRMDARFIIAGLVFSAVVAASQRLPRAATQEMILILSLAAIIYVIGRLTLDFDATKRRALIGTSLIFFAFNAVPMPFPALTWFQIDVLGFDQAFLAILSFVARVLALLVLAPLWSLLRRCSIPRITVVLSVVAAVLLTPNLGMYYGLHHWTAAKTGGLVDARLISLIDISLLGPLGQLGMIPMLAWIAQNAPDARKATYFSAFTAFMDLAQSAGTLIAKYLNRVFVVTRTIGGGRDGGGSVANYQAFGPLLITIILLTLAIPLVTVFIVQRTRFRAIE